MSLPPPETELLDAVRAATIQPFMDPVLVHGRLMSRRDARTIERALARLEVAGRRPNAPQALGSHLGQGAASGPCTGAAPDLVSAPIHEAHNGC